MGERIIVLWENAEGTPSPISSWGKIRAEKEEIIGGHILGEATKKRKRIEIRKNAEESREAGRAWGF